MAKQSALDRAIANLTQQIEALELARRHLREQQLAQRKPAKPRVVAREEKSAS